VSWLLVIELVELVNELVSWSLVSLLAKELDLELLVNELVSWLLVIELVELVNELVSWLLVSLLAKELDLELLVNELVSWLLVSLLVLELACELGDDLVIELVCE